MEPTADDYQVRYVDKPDDSVWAAIGGGIQDYNNQQAGEDHSKRLCFVVYAPNEDIVGATYWDWFYIDLLWVREEFRRRGFGHRLLTLAEDEARRRGAKNAYLDTFSFQAPDFYRQHGYQVFGQLQDFPPGHQRYYLTKPL